MKKADPQSARVKQRKGLRGLEMHTGVSHQNWDGEGRMTVKNTAETNGMNTLGILADGQKVSRRRLATGRVLGGMVLAVAGLLVACQGSVPESSNIQPSQADAQVQGALSTLDAAALSGRIQHLPGALTVKTLPVNERAVARQEEAKQGAKAIIPASTPAFDAEEAGARIKSLHEAVALSGDVRLSIALPKDEYVMGEPVTVRTTLSNVSDQALRFPPLLDPQFQYNQFLVTTPSGKVLGYSPVAIACSRGELQYETLVPGEARTEDIPVFFHKDGWMFSEPGQYTIQALFRSTADVAQRADSNRVTFTVLPGSAEDQAAARLMMGHDQGLFMMWGEGDHLEDGIDALQTLVTRYPGSALASHARYALGSNMSVNFMDGRTQVERKAVPSEVLHYLLPVLAELQNGVGPVLSADKVAGTYLKVAEAYARLGQRANVQAVLEDFQRTQADNPVLSDDDLRRVSQALQTL